MKKVLILTASTGAGHNQVAKTLEVLLHKDFEVKRVDFLREESKILELLIEDGYDILATKFPELYGRLYYVSNRTPLTSTFTKMVNRALYRRTRQIINQYNPDLIIGTHTFSVPLVSALKKKGDYAKPFIDIVTDFDAHYAYISKYVDFYITGSKYTNESLYEKGIDKGKVMNLGIPLNPVFYEPSYAPKNTDFTILLMGGSMGLDPMKEAFRELIKIEKPHRLMVVCGRNEELKSQLESIAQGMESNTAIEIYGYINNVHELMDQADLIITKPGGLTVTESIVKQLPMLIPYFIPGQEEENLDFLLLANFGIAVKKVERINGIVTYLMNHPKRLEQMRECMAYEANSYSLQHIVDTIRHFCNT